MCVDSAASGGEISKKASMGPCCWRAAMSVEGSLVSCTMEIREERSWSCWRMERLRPMAITLAPITRATLTAAEPKGPVAGATMMVSPALRSMSLSPP